MARERPLRPGDRWQPALGGRPKRRVAGRLRWRMPRMSVPRWSIRWRRAIAPVLAVTALSLGGWWLYHSPLLSIQDVAVEGNQALSADALRGIAALEDQSIIRSDFAGARERLLALPQVKDVAIDRDWPNGVRITVVERSPWGLWQVGGQRFVIDAEGVILDLPAPEGAPLIIQTDAAALPLAPGDMVAPGTAAAAGRLVAEAQRTLGRPVVGLEFSQSSGLTVLLAGGAEGGSLRIAFGDAQGYEFKVATLFALLQRAEQEGRSLSRVDLRFGDRVAYQ